MSDNKNKTKQQLEEASWRKRGRNDGVLAPKSGRMRRGESSLSE